MDPNQLLIQLDVKPPLVTKIEKSTPSIGVEASTQMFKEILDMYSTPDWVFISSISHGWENALTSAEAFIDRWSVIDTTVGHFHTQQPLHVFSGFVDETVTDTTVKGLLYNNGVVVLIKTLPTDSYVLLLWISIETIRIMADMTQTKTEAPDGAPEVLTETSQT